MGITRRNTDINGALIGVLVDRLEFIVADVGNGSRRQPVNAVLPLPRLERLAVDGVVEVARPAIDGPPAARREGRRGWAAIGGADVVGQRSRLEPEFRARPGTLLVQAPRSRFYARSSTSPSTSMTRPTGFAVQRRRLSQFATTRAAEVAVAVVGILGHEDVVSGMVASGATTHWPDSGSRRPMMGAAPLQDVEHAAFGAAFAVVAQHPHAHAVGHGASPARISSGAG